MFNPLVSLTLGAMNGVSSLISGAAATRQFWTDVFDFRFDKAAETAVEGWYWFARDCMTTASLTLGLSTSLAPEALHITDKEWKLLSYEAAVERLESWSHHEFPAESEQNRYSQEKDHVRTFLDAARVMTVASAMAYGEQEEAQTKMNDKNWTVKVLQHGRNVQAVLLMAKPELKLGGDKPVAILAFRGTELPDTDNPGQFFGDWWTNFNYSLTSYRGGTDLSAGTVAKGFLLAWRGLCPKIQQEIRHYHDQRQSEVQLYVTGHSQGAALAAVSLLDLLALQKEADSTFKLCGCLTIAQPKVGDAAHTLAVRNAMKGVPMDLVANSDVTGIDPVVAAPKSSGARTPAGRFWVVQVGETTQGPKTLAEHIKVAEASYFTIVQSILASLPLHWPGGHVGYLRALEE